MFDQYENGSGCSGFSRRTGCSGGFSGRLAAFLRERRGRRRRFLGAALASSSDDAGRVSALSPSGRAGLLGGGDGFFRLGLGRRCLRRRRFSCAGVRRGGGGASSASRRRLRPLLPSPDRLSQLRHRSSAASGARVSARRSFEGPRSWPRSAALTAGELVLSSPLGRCRQSIRSSARWSPPAATIST